MELEKGEQIWSGNLGAERVGLGEESNGEDDSNRLLLNASIPFRFKLHIQ